MIKYSLLSDTKVQLEVFNILGERIYTEPVKQNSSGYNHVKLEMNSRISSGVYFARLIVNGNANTDKFLIK